MIKVRKYKSTYTGAIFDNNNVFIDRFECSEELLDVRLQITAQQLEGYYVIFDFKSSVTCILDHKNGGILNHPHFDDPKHMICKYMHGQTINDYDIEYKKYY